MESLSLIRGKQGPRRIIAVLNVAALFMHTHAALYARLREVPVSKVGGNGGTHMTTTKIHNRTDSKYCREQKAAYVTRHAVDLHLK